ncbi:MAG: hypothetical protein WCF33_08090 [Pseudonocardiaceae bacterium]
MAMRVDGQYRRWVLRACAGKQPASPDALAEPPDDDVATEGRSMAYTGPGEFEVFREPRGIDERG